MRSILTTVIACSILSFSSAHSTEQKPQADRSPSSDKKPQPSKKERSTESLDFSGTGRPGQQTAGESRGSCSSGIKPIEAILPQSNSGKTVSGHPRIWVYFPETAKITEVEFVIQDESRQDFWRSRSTLNSPSEYQSFGLPTTENPLPVDRWYRWYVKLYCGDEVASVQYVQGWIRRVPLSAELHLALQQNQHQEHLAYGERHIWYDAIDRLLVSYHNNPNLTLEQDWRNLLGAKGVELNRLPSLAGRQIDRWRSLNNQ